MLLHGYWVEEVASIDDDGVSHGGVEALEVEGGELSPVGEDEQGVYVGGRGVGVFCVLKLRAGGKLLLGALDGGGVVGDDGASFGEQHLDQINGGGLADVVGFALEGEAEDGEAFATQGPEGGADLGEESLLLFGVDFFDLGEEAEVDASCSATERKAATSLGKQEPP